MRALAIVTIILGIAVLILGVMFIFNANAGEKEIADSVAPLPLDQVEPTYDQVFAAVQEMPQTDPQYLAMAGQRTSLGLAKANIGNVRAVRINGTVDIIIGMALIVIGAVLYRNNGEAA